MADEEVLLVVVGIDEPAGDAVGAIAADLAGVGVEDVDTVDPDLELLGFATVSLDREYVDVRLSEDDEQIPLAGVLQIAGYVQVGVHARLEVRNAAELLELRRVGLVVERAGDWHVEADIRRLPGGSDQIRTRDGAELGTNENRDASLSSGLLAALDVSPNRADSWMKSGGAGTTRSDRFCSSLPRQTSCGSRSRFRRSYATSTGLRSSCAITGSCSAVGMFLRDASSCSREPSGCAFP